MPEARFPRMLMGRVLGSEAQLVVVFIEWREEVDQEYLLDTFDLALGWFSGRGLSHDRALHLAQKLNDWVCSGRDEMNEQDRPASVIRREPWE